MKDIRIEKLANNLINYSIKLQKDENRKEGKFVLPELLPLNPENLI